VDGHFTVPSASRTRGKRVDRRIGRRGGILITRPIFNGRFTPLSIWISGESTRDPS
jgi:hypothetical protein